MEDKDMKSLIMSTNQDYDKLIKELGDIDKSELISFSEEFVNGFDCGVCKECKYPKLCDLLSRMSCCK